MGAKLSRRERIKKGIRKQLSGSSSRPRLSVYRSNKGIYAQIIDDAAGHTLAAASSLDAGLKAGGPVNAHPLTNTMTTAVTMSDLLRFFEATGHAPRWLDFPL